MLSSRPSARGFAATRSTLHTLTHSGARAKRWLASRSDTTLLRTSSKRGRALTNIVGAATEGPATFLTSQIRDNDHIMTNIAIIVAFLLPNAGRIGAKCY